MTPVWHRCRLAKCAWESASSSLIGPFVLATPFHQVGDLQASPPRVHVHLEIDLGEDRIVHFVEGRGEYLKERGARHGILATEDSQQRLRLRRGCALVQY